MQIIYGRAYIVTGHHVIQHNTALYSARSEFNSWHGVQIIYRMFIPFRRLSPRQTLRQHNRPGVNIFSKNPGARKVTLSKFHAQDSQISGVTVRSAVAMAIWRQGFVHPCSELSTNMATPL